ncbi:M16 family metallopeptidase [Candidatus Neomarinimicrobiota bacterium]
MPELVFSSDQYRVRFSARCLKDDVPLVLRLVAEQLREPAFKKSDLETVKKRYVGNLERAKESTRQQANRKFLQLLYPKGHPNYAYDIDERIAAVESVTTRAIKDYHKRNYGLGNVVVVAVGDVNNEAFSNELQTAFSNWKPSPLTLKEDDYSANVVESTKAYFTMKDKTSTDVYFGQPLGISRDHEDFYPIMMGTFILGGNFSSRLMQTVRGEQGLTYGIYGWLAGIDDGNDGFWNVWSAFAPNLLEQGRVATVEQLNTWVNEGITAEELEAKKSTITGTFKVGLATTRGLAGQILTNAERGRETSHLDNYPNIINALTLEQVNAAIQRYVDMDKAVFVAAGSVDESGQPLEE